jgi:hypothetical protein
LPINKFCWGETVTSPWTNSANGMFFSADILRDKFMG